MTPHDSRYQMTLAAISAPAFLVDDDVVIFDLNGAAAQFCGQDREAVVRRRGGEAIHCLHSTDVPDGCGRGLHCQHCVIRNSVKNCLEAQVACHKFMTLQLAQALAARELEVLITTRPISDGGEKLALVIIEDIPERQLPLYTSSQIDWHPRPWALRDFPEYAQARLRMLDFNRTITISVGDKALNVRRIGFNKFLWRDASS
jgi:hypothetical protein